MGSQIAKFAFQPPKPDYTVSRLGKDRRVQYVTTASGTKVSFVVFDHRPGTGLSRLIGGGSTADAANGNTVIFSHGNAEDLGHGLEGFELIAKELQVRLVAYDYSGYGLSSGSPSEGQAYKDIDAVFDFVTGDLNAPLDRIILMGRSLGSGPTTDKASRTPGLAGLCLLSPLATAASVVGAGGVMYPFDIFCNRRKIGKVADFPVHVIHGDKDEVVPFAHGKELAKIVEEAGRVPVTTWWAEECGHNDIEARRSRQYFASLKQFVADVDAFRTANQGEHREAMREAAARANASWFSGSSSCAS